MNALKLAQEIIKNLEDNKANNVTSLDVKKLTDVTDYVIICSALNKRHASALADKLIVKAKELGVKPRGVEGEDQGEWVLIDMIDVLVHIMQPDLREFYSLEKLWGMAEEIRQK